MVSTHLVSEPIANHNQSQASGRGYMYLIELSLNYEVILFPGGLLAGQYSYVHVAHPNSQDTKSRVGVADHRQDTPTETGRGGGGI